MIKIKEFTTGFVFLKTIAFIGLTQDKNPKMEKSVLKRKQKNKTSVYRQEEKERLNLFLVNLKKEGKRKTWTFFVLKKGSRKGRSSCKSVLFAENVNLLGRLQK